MGITLVCILCIEKGSVKVNNTRTLNFKTQLTVSFFTYANIVANASEEPTMLYVKC